MSLLDHVAQSFERQALIGTPGIVAISGGPDSVALARVLTTLTRQGRFPSLVLGHVNHQLRGAESDADETFVQQLPDAWHADRVQTHTVRLPVQRIAEERRANLESTARELRYNWLRKLAEEQNAHWLATGHTADDQAETILFRLLRGSGLKGLGGIEPCRDLVAGVHLIRPLLNCRRSEILAYLEESGQSFRQDSSNAQLRFTRNRLRHELLPLLAHQYQPNVVDVLCRLAEQARDAQTGIDALAGDLLRQAELPRAGHMLVFDRLRLASAPRFLVCAMLRLAWRREGWPQQHMDYDSWLSLAELTRSVEGARDFPGGLHARVHERVLQLSRVNPHASGSST